MPVTINLPKPVEYAVASGGTDSNFVNEYDLSAELLSALPNFQVTVVTRFIAFGVIVANVAGEVGVCRFAQVTADKPSAPGPGSQLFRIVAE